MQAYSVSNQPLPKGKMVTIFSDTRPAVGSEVEIIDNHGKVLNVAKVTGVKDSRGATGMSNVQQRYAVTTQVQA